MTMLINLLTTPLMINSASICPTCGALAGSQQQPKSLTVPRQPQPPGSHRTTLQYYHVFNKNSAVQRIFELSNKPKLIVS